MARAKYSIPQSPSEYNVQSSEVIRGSNYPTASVLDTTTSVYFRGADGTPSSNSTMDTPGYSSFEGNVNGSYRSTPRKQVPEPKPLDLRSNPAFKNTSKRGISTPKPPLATLQEDLSVGPGESPKRSRDTILQTIRTYLSPRQKLSRLRKRSVEVQGVTLSSPSSPPTSSHTQTHTYSAPVGVSSPTQSQFSGRPPIKKLRLREHFTSDELVDQLLDKKTIDWNPVLDPKTRKYYLEFTKQY